MRYTNYNILRLPLLMCMTLCLAFCSTAVAQKRLSSQEIAAIEKRYEEGKRSLTFMKDYATALRLKPAKTREEFMEKGSVIENLMQQYYSSLTDEQRMSEDCMFIYSDYTSSCSKPSFKFMLENAQRFPQNMAEKIDGLVDATLARDVKSYFSAVKAYDAAEVKALKVLAKKRGKTEEYETMFNFINARGKGNVDKYMKYCKDNMGVLNKDEQTALLGNFSALAADGDKKQKENVAAFLRNMLPELDVDVIYTIISQIVELEK